MFKSQSWCSPAFGKITAEISIGVGYAGQAGEKRLTKDVLEWPYFPEVTGHAGL